jgi:hypothetical protein
MAGKITKLITRLENGLEDLRGIKTAKQVTTE